MPPLPLHEGEGTLKVSWLSNAGWTATGYGQQTRIFAPRLNEHFDVSIHAMHGFGGAKTVWEGMTVYPQGYDVYSNDMVYPWAMDHFDGDANAGWLFILFDAWTYNRNQEIRRLHNAVWVPVDHNPLPAPVYAYFENQQGVPIAMSKFGVDKFAEHDMEALYIPHGFDPVFEPKPQADARDALGLPEDAFVVGMNAANKGNELHRKGYGEAFEGFARFAKDHPDAVLYVHADKTGVDHQIGWDLVRLADMFNIVDRVKFADPLAYHLGVPFEAMPWLYSAFDVFLNPAYGEGFGVGLIEAQACGVPVVVTDWTSMSELCGDGWKIPGQMLYHEKMGAFWKIPNTHLITEALSEAYDRPRGPSEKAVEFAAPYRADRVFDEHMLPVFMSLKERIDPVGVAA